jgi:hypothetical protein
MSNRSGDKKKADTVRKTPTLAEFVRGKAKDACVVCTLPAVVQGQLGAEATKRGFTRTEQLAWLREACGVQVDMTALTKHINARHFTEDSVND